MKAYEAPKVKDTFATVRRGFVIDIYSGMHLPNEDWLKPAQVIKATLDRWSLIKWLQNPAIKPTGDIG